MSGKPFVFVVDRHRKPLMPCTGKRDGQRLIGRLVVRQNGGFMLDDGDRAHSATWRQCVRLQRADGYQYTHFVPAW